MYNCRFHFWVILVHHLKSGLIPDDFHYCPYHLLHYRRHACQLHHLPKALMWGTYQINFNSSGFFQSCIRAAHDPYQKFNPITKEACFHRGLSTVLHYPSRGLSLTGYLCEFVCTSGYLPLGIHRSVLYAFTFVNVIVSPIWNLPYVSHFEQFASPNIISHTVTVIIVTY
jgi:hypothetical protein